MISVNDNSTFRIAAEAIADAIRDIRWSGEFPKLSVIVEDKGDVEMIVAEALSVAGLAVIVGVTGYDRRSQSGPLISGSVRFEIRVVERPSVNRSAQGFVTAQRMSEAIVKALHWRVPDGMAGPLLFSGYNRDDSDQLNVSRIDFTGECSLGMVTTE